MCSATAVEQEVWRCELHVKETELKISLLKEDELRAALRDAWRETRDAFRPLRLPCTRPR